MLHLDDRHLMVLIVVCPVRIVSSTFSVTIHGQVGYLNLGIVKVDREKEQKVAIVGKKIE